MAMNHYTGTRNGCVQDSVFDQMSPAFPGMLANASDHNLTDAMPCSETSADGLVAGLGCVAVVSPNAMPGVNDVSVRAVTANDAAPSFAGIVARTRQMGSNAKGQPAVDQGEMATVLRPVRSGGRIWVTVARGITAHKGTVHMVVHSTSPDSVPNGSFAAEEGADTIQIPNAQWASASRSGELGLIEFI